MLLCHAFFFFNDTATTEIYTLSLHDALPILIKNWRSDWKQGDFPFLIVQLAPFMRIEAEPNESQWAELREAQLLDRKSTRLNSSHLVISYAVFCLKIKKISTYAVIKLMNVDA